MVDENGKLSAPGRPDARGTEKPLSLDFYFSGTFVRNCTTPFEYGLMMPGTDCRPISSEQIRSAMGAGPGGSMMVAESDG